MKREITFGHRSAILHNGEKCAKLYIDDPALPVALADVINKEPDIDVTDISKNKDYSCIRMWHELTPGNFLSVICNAIHEVYSTDITIANAGAKDAV